jgi:hypothetical protein
MARRSTAPAHVANSGTGRNRRVGIRPADGAAVRHVYSLRTCIPEGM